jgi:hypothetical protein
MPNDSKGKESRTVILSGFFRKASLTRQSIMKGQVTEEEVKHEKAVEKVYEPGRLYAAWQQVRSNAGAAGIDGMTVETYESREAELLVLIHAKLKEGNYRFKPARRVLILKEGTSKMRKLGIPVVNGSDKSATLQHS